MLEGASGAFVSIFALAHNQDDFVRQVRAKADSYDLNVVNIQDIEKLDIRCAKSVVPTEARHLADSLSDQYSIKLHMFQTYNDP